MSISRRQFVASGLGLMAGGVCGAIKNNVWGQDVPSRVGLALTIGLGELSPAHYNPVPTKLPACLKDAQAMSKIAHDHGFYKVINLSDSKATRFEVARHIYHASQRLKAGDLFMVTISSHGFTGAIGETADDEETGKDQGWCLYDWMMIDDELYNYWKLFQAGVRILVIADVCHAGTSVKVMNYAKSLGLRPGEQPSVDAEPKGPQINPKSLPKGFDKNIGSALKLPAASPSNLDIFEVAKSLPEATVRSTYQRSKLAYDRALESVLPDSKSNSDMSASGLLLASSQDSQPSYAGPQLSAFTRELVDVMRTPPASYRELFTSIHPRMRWQTPNWYPFGVFDPVFHGQRPFVVG
jgi:hypothetical protein